MFLSHLWEEHFTCFGETVPTHALSVSIFLALVAQAGIFHTSGHSNYFEDGHLIQNRKMKSNAWPPVGSVEEEHFLSSGGKLEGCTCAASKDHREMRGYLRKEPSVKKREIFQ